MQRQGVCEKCGQCCGAEGSPYQANPWPKTWPHDFRRRRLENLVAHWPQAMLFGIINKEENTIGPVQQYGSIRITGPGGGLYHYIWVPGHAVCKHLPPYDGTNWSLECPFLKDDPGDGTRPCGLVGTKQDNAFRVACEGEPPLEKTPEEVTEWQLRYPLCSYTWE